MNILGYNGGSITYNLDDNVVYLDGYKVSDLTTVATSLSGSISQLDDAFERMKYSIQNLADRLSILEQHDLRNQSVKEDIKWVRII